MMTVPRSDANRRHAATAKRSVAASGVRTLAAQSIKHGERWLYSAGFNVRDGRGDMARVDCELGDLAYLLAAGARVAILSHQGSYADGGAGPLDFLADYLARRLEREVRYCPHALGADAEQAAAALRPGSAILLGNTRCYPGEEQNDPQLARAFARLGEKFALGGFSKAHRSHASNIGILDYLPAYASASLINETRLLAPWAAADRDRYSVCVVGGVKKEKTLIGLVGFAAIYDVVIPGGAVLNCCLRALGHEVGASSLGEAPARTIEAARAVLSGPHRGRVLLPEYVVRARRTGDAFTERAIVKAGAPIGADCAIVDFVMSPAQQDALDQLAAPRARLVVAGTPGMVAEGFRLASERCIEALTRVKPGGLLLGGDSCNDLCVATNKSTGGGAALQFLIEGDCIALQGLRLNATASFPGAA